MAAKKSKTTKKTKATKARKPRQIRVTEGAPDATASAAAEPRGYLAKLPIEELQAKYRDVVGRDTTSDNRAYLLWKIREARNGHVRVGPARTRPAKGPQQILSVRVYEDAVPLLDAAWRKHGLRSRNDLVLRALGRELAALGEQDAAARFSGEGAT